MSGNVSFMLSGRRFRSAVVTVNFEASKVWFKTWRYAERAAC